MSIGDVLAQARSQAGLTISQVSQRTRIRETIIRDIERGDFSACGGDFYARGHIRSIARAVGADPEELIREYDAAHGAPQAIRAAEVFEPSTPIKLKERRSPNWTVAMIIVLVLLIGYGVYRVVAHGSAAQPMGLRSSHHSAAPASPSSSSSPAPSPSPTSAVSHDVVIRLTATALCWVGFYTPSGAYLSQYTVQPGTTQTWTFHRKVQMRIGNPGSVVLSVNGKDLGHPGSTGQVVTLTFGPHQQLPGQAAGSTPTSAAG